MVEEEVIQLHIPFFDVLGRLGGLRVFAFPLPDIHLVRIWAGVDAAVVTAAAIAADVAANADVIVTISVIVIIGSIALFVGCGYGAGTS